MTIQPVSQPISPLRQRMLEDMAMRGLREETQRDYVRFVRSFAAFLSRSLRGHSSCHQSYFRSIMPPSICKTWPVVYVLTIRKM